MFEVSRGLIDLDMSFSSTVENIDRVDEEAMRFLARMGIEAEVFCIRLAVREGLLNAVNHGCGGDPHKTIKCGMRLKDNAVFIEINDGGCGFDWAAYMGKEMTTFTSDSGRGLAIMRKYCTDIEYNTKGSRLFLRKEIGDRKVCANRVRKQGDIVVIKPGQDIVASMAEEFRREIEPLLKECPSVVVIDLAGVEMVDSAGIGVLLSARTCANDSGSKLIVINASEDVYGVFKAIGLDQLFNLLSA